MEEVLAWSHGEAFRIYSFYGTEIGNWNEETDRQSADTLFTPFAMKFERNETYAPIKFAMHTSFHGLSLACEKLAQLCEAAKKNERSGKIDAISGALFDGNSQRVHAINAKKVSVAFRRF